MTPPRVFVWACWPLWLAARVWREMQYRLSGWRRAG